VCLLMLLPWVEAVSVCALCAERSCKVHCLMLDVPWWQGYACR
jgi:hypothetical protein